MTKAKLVPVIRKKIILYAIIGSILCYQDETACLDLKNVKSKTTNSKINQSCQVNDCEIICSEENWSWSSMRSVYNQQTQCHLDGINLTLPSNRNVPGTNFIWDWWFNPKPFLHLDIKLIGLQIDLDDTVDIGKQDDKPFALAIFTNVKYLRINNLHINDLPKWTFEGLGQLEELVIMNATIYNYSAGILNFAKGTLKSFTVIGRSNTNNISISSLIGRNSSILSEVQYVKVQYNLGVIDYSSLTAVPNVKVLDLSECYITSIRERSFDALGFNLQVLNLEKNNLTTLSGDLFSNLRLTSMINIPNEDLKIQLLDNPWHCDCSLSYLKDLLNNYTNFEENISCVSPEDQNGVLIKDANLYEITTTTTIPEIPTTTPEISDSSTGATSASPGTTTPTWTSDDDKFRTKQCHDSHNNISILSRTQEMQLNFQSGEMIMKFDSNIPSEMALIWFGSELFPIDVPTYQQGENINCVSNLSSGIVVNNLTEHITYTICLISTANTTVTPLNCLSYHHYENHSNAIWMYKSSKSLILSGISGFLISSMVAGFTIATFFMKFRGNHCKNVSLDSEFNSIPSGIKVEDTVNRDETYPKTTTEFQIYGEEICAADLEGELDSPPPLPPHPNWKNMNREHDNECNESENYYSVVK